MICDVICLCDLFHLGSVHNAFLLTCGFDGSFRFVSDMKAHVGGKWMWIWGFPNVGPSLAWACISSQCPLHLCTLISGNQQLKACGLDMSSPGSLLQSNHVESFGCLLYGGDECSRTPFAT